MVLSYILKLYRLCWRLAFSFLIATALLYLVQHLVRQPTIIALIPQLHLRIAAGRLAFPSGTIMIATVVALSLLPYLSNFWRLVLPVWIVALGIARIYLGVQTPLDLIGGLALGSFLVSLIRVMPQTIRVFLRLD
jgi:membrane-associated phospholipid phosphatase